MWDGVRETEMTIKVSFPSQILYHKGHVVASCSTLLTESVCPALTHICVFLMK